MKRKINRVGINTLTVSLPSKWAKEQKLKPGDEVEVEEGEAELRIGIQLSKEYLKTEIKLGQGNDWYVDQVIRNFYLAGFDEIKVKFDDEKIIPKIQNTLNRLIGLEIVEYGKDYCTLKIISSGNEAELDFFLRKAFLLVKTLFETAIKQLETEKIDLEQIKNQRSNLQRFANLYRRTITKTQKYTLMKNREIYTLVSRLMMIGNNILYAHQYLNTLKDLSAINQVKAYLEKVSVLYTLFYETFYNKDLDKLLEISNLREELIDNQFVALCKVVKRVHLPTLHYYAEAARLIASTGGAILKYHYS